MKKSEEKEGRGDAGGKYQVEKRRRRKSKKRKRRRKWLRSITWRKRRSRHVLTCAVMHKMCSDERKCAVMKGCFCYVFTRVFSVEDFKKGHQIRYFEG